MMNILYVDESGDPGISEYGSKHFILSGLIVLQDDWPVYLSRLKQLRKELKKVFGFNQRWEIHAAELIRIKKESEYKAITKTARIHLLRHFTGELPKIFTNAKAINICIDKLTHRERDIFELAWSRLLQRYDTFLKKNGKDKGIVVVDSTDSAKLQRLQRKMRVYNPTPSYFGSYYDAPIDNIIEDPFSRDSKHSYFIQSVDVMAHLLYRKEYPKGSLKKYGLQHYFKMLEPLLLKEASRNDEFGIVRK
jgi:hypothetical protein